MLDKLPLPKIEEWQIKLGIVGVQLIAITVLLAFIFSGSIDKDEKKRAKAPAMKNALAHKADQRKTLERTQWHYPNSPTLDIPIERAMKLVIRDAKAGARGSLVPAVGQHDAPTRPVGVVAAAADLPPLEMGKFVWKNKGCMSCHTIDRNAPKLAGPTWAGLYGSKRPIKGGATVEANDDYLKESITSPTAKIVDGYPPAMPLLPLKDNEIEGVIEFIKSLKDK